MCDRIVLTPEAASALNEVLIEIRERLWAEACSAIDDRFGAGSARMFVNLGTISGVTRETVSAAIRDAASSPATPEKPHDTQARFPAS
jgi:hypothetical protein